MKPADGWWRQGVIYQIHPRSFADTPRCVSLGSGRIRGALHSAAGAQPPKGLERVELQAAEGVVVVLASVGKRRQER